MESLKLEADGDISFEMISGEAELAQCCRILLGTNKGEWFLNPDSGIDYALLTGKDLNETQLHDELTASLLQEDRIRSVDDVSFSIDTQRRTLSASFSATGVDGGSVSLQEVLLGAG